MSRGHDRERDVRRRYEDLGYLVVRAAGSLGDVDLVLLKAGTTPVLAEVKSTAGGPYERFGPADRKGLLEAAALAGAHAILVWWPPRGQMQIIPSVEWPEARR